MGRFDGMTMVVTGAASGIGLATVRRLLDDGAGVVGCDLGPGNEMPDGPGGYTFVTADVTDEAAVAEVVRGDAACALREGRLLVWGVAATGVLVEALLGRGADGDVVEAEAAIERLAAAPADDGLAARDIWLLRLRALLARAHDDFGAYAHLRDRYCAMAESLGFEGHIAWAKDMIEGGDSPRSAILG